MPPPIRLELQGKVGTLTIARNERRNSLDNDAIDAFLAALLDVRRSPAIALVITGEGDRAFCAGSDLKALATYSEAEVAHHTHLFQMLTETIDELPCATIAAIEGACLGGGLEIALACDSRIANPDARFGFPEITVGVLPTGGGTIRAPRAIGLARTREMMLFGEPILAPEAQSIGLISRIAPSGEVRKEALRQAAKLADCTNRDAVMLLKAMLVTGAGTPARVGAMMAYLSDLALSRSANFLKKPEEKGSKD
ncbi:MAG: enoyl-CoA hydratase/isomerase family protein [Dongiaceae bacterium]